MSTPELRNPLEDGSLKIVGGVYEMKSGKVYRILTDLTSGADGKSIHEGRKSH